MEQGLPFARPSASKQSEYNKSLKSAIWQGGHAWVCFDVYFALAAPGHRLVYPMLWQHKTIGTVAKQVRKNPEVAYMM
eukprot:7409143-Alexandrium_andersonii.AAC.1